MAYAIRNDGLGWRRVDSEADLLEGETYSEEQPAAVPADQRIFEIKLRLAQVDFDTMRPLRAVLVGTATQFDRDKLAELEAEAVALRAELAGQ